MAIVAVTAIALSPIGEAIANSATGDPTSWNDGISAGMIQSEIYFVPPGSMILDVALGINDLAEKPNFVLTATDPAGFVIVCGPTPAINSLLVSECVIPAPLAGIWTFTVAAGPIINNPVGYTVFADTGNQTNPDV